MADINETSGKLTPTGKNHPQTGVRVAISEELLVQELPNGMRLTQKKSVVHSVTPQNGETLAAGDFDLALDGKLLRLKKTADTSQWLVLSSPK